jgi:hypothetical protein
VTAIDVSGITAANTSPPPIDIERVIFNHNYIGIKISNSTTIDSVALNVSGCVFASKDMPFATFPSTPSWSSSDMSSGLRSATNPTTGLAPPYTFPGCFQSNLKEPYSNQFGECGIKVENVTSPTLPYCPAGVQIGNTYPGSVTNDFNLFDGLRTGIQITDASFTTRNNVFQNMQAYPASGGWLGGDGINHTITGLMNAKLNLKTDLTNVAGNRFYDCVTGVNVFNVLELSIRFALFRSTQSVLTSTVYMPFPMPGRAGVQLETNRFNWSIVESEFNNLDKGIIFSTPVATYSFDVNGSGPVEGIDAGGFDIERNYFGAEVTSTTSYSGGFANASEYMNEAISITTPNPTSNWSTPSNQTGYSYIGSNKIDRAFRGIFVNGMEDTPLSIVVQ